MMIGCIGWNEKANVYVVVLMEEILHHLVFIKPHQ